MIAELLFSIKSSVEFSEQLKNESTRFKYFHDVLSTDFDFIINTIIPLISVSPKETIAFNSKLEGLADIFDNEHGIFN